MIISELEPYKLYYIDKTMVSKIWREHETELGSLGVAPYIAQFIRIPELNLFGDHHTAIMKYCNINGIVTRKYIPIPISAIIREKTS